MRHELAPTLFLAVGFTVLNATLVLAAGPAGDFVPDIWQLRPMPHLMGSDGRAIPSDIVSEDNPVWLAQAGKPTGDTWLGVQLTPVPPALAAQLEVSEGAVVVGNIFRDSPADKAGLRRYDVIVAADGKPVEGGVKGFSKCVGEKRPGDTMELTVIRRNSKSTLVVELTRWPADRDKLELKYPNETVPSDQMGPRLRGKILRPGPRGWELHDLGELPEEFDDLLEWYSSRDGVDELHRVDEQGRVLHIERRDDGQIVVRRYQSGHEDQAEVKKYDNMEALAAGDPEAHRLLESARSKGGPGGERRWDFLGRWPGDKEAWRRYQDSLREHLDELRRRLDAMQKEIEGTWPEREQRWREWGQRFFQGPLRKWKEGFDAFNLPEESPDRPAPSPPPPLTGATTMPAPAPPPAVHFEVDAKGQVKVHFRDQDRELSMSFESREQFARQAPELYQQFQALERQVR